MKSALIMLLSFIWGSAVSSLWWARSYLSDGFTTSTVLASLVTVIIILTITIGAIMEEQK